MKLALVVGCADCVWDEVEAAQNLATFDHFYVCKMAGIDWDEGWFHWITLHPEYMIGERGYKQTRVNKGLPNDYEIVAPLTGEAGHFARGKPWLHVNVFTEAWKETEPVMRGKVKSLSGWTQQLLGAPTEEWLAQARDAQTPAGEMPVIGS